MLKELNLQLLNDLIINSQIPVLVMFKTKWCKMCEIDEVTITKYCNNNSSKIIGCKIDVDKFNLWREYNDPDFQIDKVPSYKIFYKNQIIYNSEKCITYLDLDKVLSIINI